MTNATTKRWIPYALRLPPEVKKELSYYAELNCRSLNSEIVHRLQRSLEGYRKL